MISKKMQDALNDQINAEFYSAYLYMAMQAYFESENLRGMAKWMAVQVTEETKHGLKIFDYLNERFGRVALKAIAQPSAKWNSPLSAFEAAYKHEQGVTERINKLMNLALEEKDHASGSFLRWFVDEQVEEEASVAIIVEKLKMIKDAAPAILMLDHELGSRGT